MAAVIEVIVDEFVEYIEQCLRVNDFVVVAFAHELHDSDSSLGLLEVVFLNRPDELFNDLVNYFDDKVSVIFL